MIRIAGVALLLLGLPAAALAAPLLKPAVVVQGPAVLLGDLFTDAGERARIPVAAAPPPGSKMILNTSWLAALAQSQHLSWRPVSSFEQATVERASRSIGGEEIGEYVKAALASRTPVEDAELKLDQPDLRLQVAAEAPATLVLQSLSFDTASGRFSALLSTAEGGSAPDRLRVNGQLVRLAEIATPIRVISPGETIARADLTQVRVRSDKLGQGALVQAGDLVGKTPRRALRPGDVVRAVDVEVPLVVRRNSLVTIVLETPTMRLTAEGKAIEDGGMGAVIRVANTKSNRVIDALVAGPNTVRVGLAERTP